MNDTEAWNGRPYVYWSSLTPEDAEPAAARRARAALLGRGLMDMAGHACVPYAGIGIFEFAVYRLMFQPDFIPGVQYFDGHAFRLFCDERGSAFQDRRMRFVYRFYSGLGSVDVPGSGNPDFMDRLRLELSVQGVPLSAANPVPESFFEMYK